MSEEQKQIYCKLGQAVSNVACLLAVSGTFAFYIVYALIH